VSEAGWKKKNAFKPRYCKPGVGGSKRQLPHAQRVVWIVLSLGQVDGNLQGRVDGRAWIACTRCTEGVGCCRAHSGNTKRQAQASDVRGLSVNYWQLGTECAGG
jgi:hypothetical protein